MKISMRSIFSGKMHTMDLPITLQQWHRWKVEGVLVQNAFPNLTPEQREFLLTGAVGTEWDDNTKERTDG